jgi:hypothetical protein
MVCVKTISTGLARAIKYCAQLHITRHAKKVHLLKEIQMIDFHNAAQWHKIEYQGKPVRFRRGIFQNERKYSHSVAVSQNKIISCSKLIRYIRGYE